MFTVIITEKEHMDRIREYHQFLEPFLCENKVKFCEWIPGEGTLDETVPHLAETVAGHDLWRAIILCTDAGLHLKNPFQMVSYAPPVIQEELSDAQRLSLVQEAKFRAFEEASHQPLTCLVTHLCESPLVSEGRNHASEDPEFGEYMAEVLQKQKLREQILKGEKMKIVYPAEVLCVARRTCDQQAYNIHVSWTAHEDIEYSRFYDWNMYFDKMRYLVYDIAPKAQNHYEISYIRFLYVVLILANHDLPSGVLRPNRVFVLECEDDEKAFRTLLIRYDEKLSLTEDGLRDAIGALEKTEKPRLTDREANILFCSRVNIPVSIPKELDVSGLYANPEAVGLSFDCPEDENVLWHNAYKTSQHTLQELLKQPRRSLKKAVSEMRRLNKTDLDKAEGLNEFQIDDIKEYLYREEKQMVSVDPPDLSNMERYQKEMEVIDRKIRRMIRRRMSRKTTIGVTAAALGLYLIGFLPLLVNNLSGAVSRLWAGGFIAVALLLMSGTALLCIFSLRSRMKRLLKEFNAVMYRIYSEIENSVAVFSQYLSHVCNVMRGFHVLDYCGQKMDPVDMKVRVLEMHLLNITRTRKELYEVFSPYLTMDTPVDSEQKDSYQYDFTRPVDYQYPMPYTENMRRQIEFMQPGNLISAPVDYVRRITVRREELYD